MKQYNTPLFLLIMLMSMVGTKSFAYDIVVANADGKNICYKWIENKTELEVYSAFIMYHDNIIIPESVIYNGNTYPVTSIRDEAFTGKSLASITIPNSVRYIGKMAFSSCSALTSITIGNSVTWIGDDAFSGCSGLTSITIPNSVWYIGKRAFGGCSALTSITIGNSVTSIGDYAFYKCSGLTSITIPNSVKSIGDDAFYKCSGLTSITIGNSVTSIGEGAFCECSCLTSITIGNSVTSIGDYAFSGCSALNAVHISDVAAWCGISFHDFRSNPLSFANHLYLNGKEVKDLVIPNSITKIRNYAFNHCSGLTSVTIPNSVTWIGDDAFFDCSALTSITIPNSVTWIGDDAFSDCSGLTSVTFHCETIHSWFSGKKSIKDVTIGDEVTRIGSSAFSGCSGLNSLKIGNSVTRIEEKAFFDCSALTSITIPNSVTSIGKGAFYGCNLSKVISLILEPFSFYFNSFTYGVFDDYTLSNATLIVPYGTIGKYKTTDGWKRFKWIEEGAPTDSGEQDEVKEFTYNDIKYTVLSQADQTVEVAAGKGTAGEDGNVKNIGDMVIPSTVSYAGKTYTVVGIGESAFINYIITSLSLPNTLTYIGKEAFSTCMNLKTITIPQSVTTIGTNAFWATSISEMIVMNPVPIQVPYNAFIYLQDYNDCVLFVPAGSSNAYRNANEWSKFSKIVEMQKEPDKLDGHEYVDLGLPSGKCWATMNYGATTPEGYGSYLEWSSNNVIATNWGSGWTTPSLQDIRELENNCTWTWGQKNGHYGYTVTGKNGNSIFLPASGFQMSGQSSAKKVGEWVYYWTSSPSDGMAYIILSTSSNVWYGEMETSYTYLPIRPITKDSYSSGNENNFEGEGTELEPYMIKTADDLTKLSSLVNSGNSYSGSYFKLSDNIEMTGRTFVPIGNQEHPFSGVFEGDGYYIKGISVNATSFIGLFGYADGATINNLGVENENLTGTSYIGGIAGYSHNTVITNCFTSGLTSGNDCVGAIVGYSGEGTVIQNCFSSLQHTRYEIFGSVGGLVGYNCGMLENSYYGSTINAKIFEKNTTGGIVGYNHSTGSIYYCYYVKYGNVINGEFNYCGILNWGNCYGIESFDLNCITTSGSYLYERLNSWVSDHSSKGHYRKWTNERIPSFADYAEPEEQNDSKEFVDLGLPSGLLWATRNVGSNRPEEFGSYFAWGETTPKDSYSWDTYKYANGSNTSLTKYCTSYSYGKVDYIEVLEEKDDAATANWGKPWRTPTLIETQELINKCKWTSTTRNGVNGYTVTGPNGNSIFIPAAGIMVNNVPYITADACLQTATIFNADNGNPASASVLYIEKGTPHKWYGWDRCWGYSVRPVMSADQTKIPVASADVENEIIGIYDLRGHKLDNLQKGINIVKYKNGEFKKVSK